MKKGYKMRKVVSSRHARDGEYHEVLETSMREGKCPFCPENFKYHKNPILRKDGNWFITKISWPYENTAFHFIIIGEEHKEHFEELSQRDLISVRGLASWAITKFEIKGGALTIRFGDTEYSGATVCHLHFHLISPQVEEKQTKAVNFPIG